MYPSEWIMLLHQIKLLGLGSRVSIFEGGFCLVPHAVAKHQELLGTGHILAEAAAGPPRGSAEHLLSLFVQDFLNFSLHFLQEGCFLIKRHSKNLDSETIT